MVKTFFPRRVLPALLAIAISCFLSGPAFSACETPGSAAIGGTAAQTAITGAMQGVLNQAWKLAATAAVTVTVHVPVQNKLNNMNDAVIDRLRAFWDDWDKAWRDMSAQIGAGTLDQTRQLTSIADVTNSQQPASTYQETEYDAKINTQPSVEGCGFDTTARYSNAAELRSAGIANAMANDIKKLGTNNKGTPAAQGPGAMQKSDWATYTSTFCDPNANGGSSGCSTPGALMNADIQPGKTIFGRDTINMADPSVRKATQALTRNIIGFDVPKNIAQSELKSPAGKEKRNTTREYLTQMDAVSALVTSQIGEKSPGDAAPEIKAKRMANGIPACAAGAVGAGTCASDRPSEWEIRQSVIEEVRNPNYYVNLQDSSPSTLQKEVLLQAYNVMMLYKLIEKSEMISNAYAIQTGNMLQRIDQSRSSGGQFSQSQEAAAPAAPTGAD